MAERSVTLRMPWTDARYQITGDAADDSVIKRIAAHEGHYEPDVMIHLQRTVRDGWTVLDVGANVGVLAVTMAKLTPSGRVVAFEPSSQNFGYLVRNLNDNGLTNVEALQVAVGRAEGEASLSFDPGFAGGAFIATDDAPGRELVRVVSLDDWWRERGLPPIQLLKVDVEGFEQEVLAGANELLRSCQPDLVIEYNPVAHQLHGTPIQGMSRTLRRAYRWIFWIREDGANVLITSRRHLRHLLLRKGSLDLYCTVRRRPKLVGNALVMTVRAVRDRLRLVRDYNRFRLPIRNFVVSPGVSIAALGGVLQLTDEIEFDLRITNGSRAWLSSSFKHHPVTIGLRWREEGRWREVRERTLLPVPVRPGKTAQLRVRAAAPPTRGRNLLRVALVQEGFAWLDELYPEAGIKLELECPE